MAADESVQLEIFVFANICSFLANKVKPQTSPTSPKSAQEGNAALTRVVDLMLSDFCLWEEALHREMLEVKTNLQVK